MISARLVQLIEKQGDEIIARVTARLRHERTITKEPMLEGELRDWGRHLLDNLGYWLSKASAEDLEHRYERLGRVLFEQDIPLHEALRAALMVRETIVDYMDEQVLTKTSVNLYAEEEMERRLGLFFDLLAVHLAKGYERALRSVLAAAGTHR